MAICSLKVTMWEPGNLDAVSDTGSEPLSNTSEIKKITRYKLQVYYMSEYAKKYIWMHV